MTAEGKVSVWALCSFTEEMLEAYTEYQYDKDEISRFCQENGIDDEEIDEDFMDQAVFDDVITDIKMLLDGCSYSASFMDAFAGVKLPENCNGVIAVYHYAHENRIAENPSVVFLGTADFQAE